MGSVERDFVKETVWDLERGWDLFVFCLSIPNYFSMFWVEVIGTVNENMKL